jgi:hypothetical protein
MQIAEMICGMSMVAGTMTMSIDPDQAAVDQAAGMMAQ